jgi:hypothetical protein
MAELLLSPENCSRRNRESCGNSIAIPRVSAQLNVSSSLLPFKVSLQCAVKLGKELPELSTNELLLDNSLHLVKLLPAHWL